MAADGTLTEVRSPDGTMLGVEVVGDGPPLVAVHGGTADRTRWAPVVAPLAERFTLYLLDRRGRGASTREADGPYALGLETDDVVAVLQAAGDGEPVRLLGHSYGALIGLDVLRRAPSSVARALLYEPPFDTPGHRVVSADALATVKARLAGDDREGALVAFYELVIGMDPAPIRALPVWQARLAAVHTIVREGEIGLQFAPDPADFADVRVPVRLLAGTESPAPFGAAARAAADAIPGAELVWLEGQAHTMIDADPPGFVEHVLSFLA
jgi:pimeloyl-ACP methyl ester carboxylesterase